MLCHSLLCMFKFSIIKSLLFKTVFKHTHIKRHLLASGFFNIRKDAVIIYSCFPLVLQNRFPRVKLLDRRGVCIYIYIYKFKIYHHIAFQKDCKLLHFHQLYIALPSHAY